MTGVSRLVIWAHSECRSTAALFLESKKLAESEGVAVDFCLLGKITMPMGRRMALPGAVMVGEDVELGMSVLRQWGGTGTVHVFCSYQNVSSWRQLMVVAKSSGARVVVYSEAPCEMCLGLKAFLKRLYFQWVLPWRVRAGVRAADCFISQSGRLGSEWLLRLGWCMEKVRPFGYVSPRLDASSGPMPSRTVAAGRVLRVLHVGSEAPYRGVRTLDRAVRLMEEAGKGNLIRIVKTGGGLPVQDLVREIHEADVVVACGLCEPWGMRVNDVLLEGTPVIVSDGMGAAMLCDRYGCGCVVRRGDAAQLAVTLLRVAEDRVILEKWREGAARAARKFTPERQARNWLALVVGEAWT